MKSRIQEFYSLEQLSGGSTCIHRLHPLVKLLAAVFFIIVVVSFGRYDFGRLIPFIFYPALLMALSETPYTMLLKRLLIALPFCLLAGIANMIFDTAADFTIGSLTVSYGMISFFTIIVKTCLCVMAVLILIAVTPVFEITNTMRRLRIPHIFIVIFEMVYRYIGVIFDEAYSIFIAYSLRSVNKKGIHIRDMGSVIGQLLLRSFDRSDRVYNAMKCRGYALRAIPGSRKKITAADFVFIAAVCVFAVIFRVVKINELWEKILSGLIS